MKNSFMWINIKVINMPWLLKNVSLTLAIQIFLPQQENADAK